MKIKDYLKSIFIDLDAEKNDRIKFAEVNERKDDDKAGSIYEFPYYIDKCEEFKVVYNPMYFGWGSQSGCTVQRSNFEVFIERFGKIEGVYIDYGYYSFRNIWLDLELDNDEIIKVLKDLDNYPLIDEEHRWALEHELQDLAWEELGVREEFKQGLEEKYPDKEEEILDRISDNDLRCILERLADITNNYWMCEDAVSASIDINAILEESNWEDVQEILSNLKDIPPNLELELEE